MLMDKDSQFGLNPMKHPLSKSYSFPTDVLKLPEKTSWCVNSPFLIILQPVKESFRSDF